ncbi:retrovirus-related pol polyprotein from transposon TNT 1-94 [Tanacetum coccineum]
MKKVYRILSMTDCDERKHVLDYTHVDLQYVEDQRKDLATKFNALKQDLAFQKFEVCNLKNTVFINSSLQNEVIRVNLENKSLKDEISDLKKESLPPLPKLTRAKPSDTSDCLISLSNLTVNMSELTLNSASSKGNKKTSDKVSKSYVIKKKVVPVPSDVHASCSDKKLDSSTEQLLLTLMEEVKGIKDHIKIPYATSPSDYQESGTKPLKKCPTGNQLTKNHTVQPVVNKALKKLKGQSPLKPTPRKTTRMSKQFDDCIYCGSDKHHPDDCEFYPGCEICGRLPKEEPGPKVVFGDNSLGDTEGFGLVNCNGITFTRVAYVNGLKHNLISISQLCDANFKVLFTKTQGTIYNQKDEVVLIAPRRRYVYVIDMSSYNSKSNACFYAKASPSINWLWHKRLSHLNLKNINNLAKHNLVSGLPSLTFSKDKNCSACEKGMHYRATFKTKKIILHQQVPTSPSYGFMENLNDTKVKQLRSDNGIAFINHTLEAFYDEKAARTMLNSARLPKQFWGEAVNVACYTQNRSIIVKRHMKIAYEVLRGRAPGISYFYVFGCPMHIHNHIDHLGKFDEKADDGFFLDDEAISQISTEGDAINFNEVISFPDDEFIKPINKETLYTANTEYFPNVPAFDRLSKNLNKNPSEPIIVSDPPIPLASQIPEESPVFSNEDEILAMNEAYHSMLADDPNFISGPLVLQDRWSIEKHIDLVNIIGEPLAGITTRSRVRDSEAALAHECIYVNFLSQIEPKRLIEALEEEGWVLAMTKELNQFERNKV